MKIIDNEGEIIVNLTDVKDDAHLQSLLDKEDTQLTEVMYETPFFAMSLETYKEEYEDDCEGLEERVCTYEEWMSEVRQWAQECLEY